ncbi:MAG: P-type ATPase, partial [Acidimicrobiia bacterium]
MLYEGTSIAAGDATAVVVAVGSDTEARRGLAFLGGTPESGVEVRLHSLLTTAVPVSLLSGAGVVAVGMLRGRPLRDVLGAGVSLAVAAVPEGLPFLATVAQLGAARRLSRRGALVRNPRAIEALGRVDVVCADKTGTLTLGEIRLRLVSDGVTEAELDDLRATHRDTLAAALRAGPDPTGPAGLPHPTDRACAEGAGLAGVGESHGLDGWVRRKELPFEPARGYHATLGDAGPVSVLCLKGAPEIVLPRCSQRSHGGRAAPLDEAASAGLREVVDRMG